MQNSVLPSTPRICVRCGRSRRAGEVECPGLLEGGERCGCELYSDRVRGDARPAEPEAAPLRGLLGELLQLPAGDVAVVYGPKGAGKSTLALTAFDAPIYLTSEMPAATILRYARRCKVRLGEIVQYQRQAERCIDGVEVLPVIPLSQEPGEVVDLIIDSISATGEPELAFAALRDFCAVTGARALALVQVTKDHQARGSEAILHMADAVVRVDHRRIVVEKTRSGAGGALPFTLTAAGPRRLVRKGFFSVEGPPYRLLGYPDPTAQFDSLLRRAERDRTFGRELRELREHVAGIAVAGRVSALYAAGAVEPDDWRERARCALLEGAAYYHAELGALITREAELLERSA